MTTAKQVPSVISRIARLSSFAIVPAYAGAGLVCILLSDTWGGKPLSALMAYHSAYVLKGFLFVMISTALLHMLLRKYMAKVQSAGDIMHASFHASSDAICINSLADETFLKINKGFTRMTGYSESDVLGRTSRDICIWNDPVDRIKAERQLADKGELSGMEAKFRTKDDVLVDGSMDSRIVDMDGRSCVVTVVRDRTQEVMAMDEVKRLAHYDPETGLPNHQLFIDRFNQAIVLCTRERRKTAVIYISLTGFKAVVDIIGHNGGSDVLKAVSGNMVSVLRPYDTVARIHRDEFVVLLGGSVPEMDVTVVLEKLQQVFAIPVTLEKGEFVVTASMGVSCFPADGMTADILMQNAHIAMNQAVNDGASSRFYSASMNQKAMERYSIEGGMLRAINEGEFVLHYQPKFAINGRDLSGVEALVRWNRPGVGLIPPDKFISVAEDNGMILRLGEWVLREACRQNRAWQDAGLPKICVSVNIAAKQLRDKGFVDMVMGILETSGIDPGNLELELTESSVMGNSDDTVHKLLRLKQYGVSISIDDFGTGYSSLSYLKHLPIDTIKIDRTFVRDIVENSDDAAIVHAIVAMAHALKLRVVAEGVETAGQLEFLRKGKCHEAQGYYFARPLDAGAFQTFLQSGFDSASINFELPAPPLTVSDAVKTAVPEFISTDNAECIGDIYLPVVPAQPSDNLSVVLKRFQTEKSLQVLPIVDMGYVVGIINRSTFLEENVIGMHGYAFQINHSKKMRDLMIPVPLVLDAGTPIKNAAQSIQAKGHELRVDNVCITRNGQFAGIVDVNKFINAITEINLTLAKGANPLTGLPGNESIQREINERLHSGHGFDIAYVDIDNFKPYNDYYGFQKGDVVIKAVADIVTMATNPSISGQSVFCGHIGGDDFIIISQAGMGQSLSQKVIRSFDEHQALFHGNADYAAGSYTAVNRKGEPETFQLLSISIGIVNTLLTPVRSYAQLASLSTEVKKSAKGKAGSSIVINKRRVD